LGNFTIDESGWQQSIAKSTRSDLSTGGIFTSCAATSAFTSLGLLARHA
jgi:hypothetical protein